MQRVAAIEPVQRQLAGLDGHGPADLLAPVELGLCRGSSAFGTIFVMFAATADGHWLDA